MNKIAEEVKQKVEEEKKKDEERKKWEEEKKQDSWEANRTRGKYL